MVDARAGDVALRFEILGPLRAWWGAEELDVGPAKQRAVLAVLLTNANKPVHTARIVENVWGQDQPENGANVVQKYVSGLRRVLEPHRPPRTPGQLLTLTNAGYLLRIEPGCLDVEVFRGLVGTAREVRAGGDLAGAGRLLSQANALWRAEAMAGLSEAGLETLRNSLDEMRLAALEEWAEVELEVGHHNRLVPDLVRLVVEHPMRERLRCLHMLALYRCGRQAEAHTAYRDARSFLVEQFGVEPGTELQQLHQRMLHIDPTLEWRDHSAPPPDVPPPDLRGPLVPGYPPAATAWAPVPGWPRIPAQIPAARPGVRHWAGRLLAVGVPIMSFGLASWAVVAYLAGRGRRWSRAAAAAGYFVLLAIVLFAAAASGPESATLQPLEAIEMIALFVAMLGGATHTALVSLDPHPPADSPAGSAPPKRGAWARWARCLAVAVPLVSFGFLTWIVVGAYAGRRRSLALGLSAAGYLGLIAAILFLYDLNAGSSALVATDGIWLLALFVNTFGGTAQVALVSSPAYWPPPAPPAPPASPAPPSGAASSGSVSGRHRVGGAAFGDDPADPGADEAADAPVAGAGGRRAADEGQGAVVPGFDQVAVGAFPCGGYGFAGARQPAGDRRQRRRTD